MTTDQSVPEDELGPMAESVAPRSRNTRKKWTGDPRTEELLDVRIADRFEAFPDLARQLDSYRNHASNIRVAVALRAGMIARARMDPAAMMEFVFDKPNHEPARLGWMHRLWLELMQEHPRLLIVAPRRHWKCLPDDEVVTVASGARVRAVDMPEHCDIVSWAPKRGWVVTKAHKRENVAQPIYTIETVTGRRVRVSPEHPFLTPTGWVEAEKLKPEDVVAVARGHEQAVFKGVEVDPGLAWLTGMLLGDGGLTRPSTLRVTIADDRVKALVEKLCEPLGWKLVREFADINYIITGNGVSRGNPINWIRELGLHGCDSHAKFIPDRIFGWSKQAIANLISGYLASDGSVVDGRAGVFVWFESVSRKMLESVQSLLLRYSVQSVLGDRNTKASHYLCIGGSSLIALADLLSGCEGPKVEHLREIAAMPHTNDNLDLVPDAIVDQLSNRFSRTIPRLDNRRLRGHQRWKVVRRAEMDGFPRIGRLANLSWERIRTIRLDPPERTWSFSVPETEVLLAGDFVTHNTGSVLGYILHRLGREPDLLTKIVCQSDGKAVKRVGFLRELIEKNKRLGAVFPIMSPTRKGRRIDLEWNKHALTVPRRMVAPDPSIEALGITSSASGDRADLVFADDVVDRRNAITLPKVRQQIRESWDDWVNLLGDSGSIIYACTLWSNCLHPDTPIVTEGGVVVLAKCINARHRLLVGPGQWERPVLVTRQSFAGCLVRITVKNMGIDPILCTPGHRLPLRNGIVSEASEIRAGEVLSSFLCNCNDDGLTVARVDTVPYSGPVYDLTTSTGFFELEGVTSHNSDLTTDLLKNPGWAIAWFEVKTNLGTYVRMPDGSEFNHKQPLWGTDPNCHLHGHEYFGVSRDEFLAKMDAKPKSDQYGPICELLANGKIKLGDESCRCGPWTRKALEKRRQDIGSRKFARGFSNRPMADDEKRVKPSWIQWAWEMDENGLPVLDENGQKVWKVIDPTWLRIIIIDSQSSLKKTADWLGFVVLALDEASRKIYVLEGRHYRLAFPDKVRLVKVAVKHFKPVDWVLIEKAGGGTELYQELVINTRLPVAGVRARAGKIDRLDRITPTMEAGMVEFMPYLDPDVYPRDDDTGCLPKELKEAPSGETDDIMDAFVHGVRFVNRMYPAFYQLQDGPDGPMPGDALDQDEDDSEADRGTDEEDGGARVSVF